MKIYAIMANTSDGLSFPIRYASTKELAAHLLKDTLKETRAAAYQDVQYLRDHLNEYGEDRTFRLALERAEERIDNINMLTITHPNGQEEVVDRYEIKEIDVETEAVYNKEQGKIIFK
jgi:hypothetical protein